MGSWWLRPPCHGKQDTDIILVSKALQHGSLMALTILSSTAPTQGPQGPSAKHVSPERSLLSVPALSQKQRQERSAL